MQETTTTPPAPISRAMADIQALCDKPGELLPPSTRVLADSKGGEAGTDGGLFVLVTYLPHPHLFITRPVSFEIKCPPTFPDLPPVVRCLDESLGAAAKLDAQGRPKGLILLSSETTVGGWSKHYGLAEVIHAVRHYCLRKPDASTVVNTVAMDEALEAALMAQLRQQDQQFGGQAAESETPGNASGEAAASVPPIQIPQFHHQQIMTARGTVVEVPDSKSSPADTRTATTTITTPHLLLSPTMLQRPESSKVVMASDVSAEEALGAIGVLTRRTEDDRAADEPDRKRRRRASSGSGTSLGLSGILSMSPPTAGKKLMWGTTSTTDLAGFSPVGRGHLQAASTGTGRSGDAAHQPRGSGAPSSVTAGSVASTRIGLSDVAAAAAGVPALSVSEVVAKAGSGSGRSSTTGASGPGGHDASGYTAAESGAGSARLTAEKDDDDSPQLFSPSPSPMDVSPAKVAEDDGVMGGAVFSSPAGCAVIKAIAEGGESGPFDYSPAVLGLSQQPKASFPSPFSQASPATTTPLLRHGSVVTQPSPSPQGGAPAPPELPEFTVGHYSLRGKRLTMEDRAIFVESLPIHRSFVNPAGDTNAGPSNESPPAGGGGAVAELARTPLSKSAVSSAATSNAAPTATLCAVMDGHGGTKAAEFVASRLASLLAAYSSSSSTAVPGASSASQGRGSALQSTRDGAATVLTRRSGGSGVGQDAGSTVSAGPTRKPALSSALYKACTRLDFELEQLFLWIQRQARAMRERQERGEPLEEKEGAEGSPVPGTGSGSVLPFVTYEYLYQSAFMRGEEARHQGEMDARRPPGSGAEEETQGDADGELVIPDISVCIYDTAAEDEEKRAAQQGQAADRDRAQDDSQTPQPALEVCAASSSSMSAASSSSRQHPGSLSTPINIARVRAVAAAAASGSNSPSLASSRRTSLGRASSAEAEATKAALAAEGRKKPAKAGASSAGSDIDDTFPPSPELSQPPSSRRASVGDASAHASAAAAASGIGQEVQSTFHRRYMSLPLPVLMKHHTTTRGEFADPERLDDTSGCTVIAVCLAPSSGVPPPPPGYSLLKPATTAGSASSNTSLDVAAVWPAVTAHIACAGDSRAILCRGGFAVDLSQDHKATTRMDEKARILTAGGVLIKGRVLGRLAVTRAIGDLSLKRGRGEEFLVSGEPEIYSLPLLLPLYKMATDGMTMTPQPGSSVAPPSPPPVSSISGSSASGTGTGTSKIFDEFILLCCDGVTDVLTSQQCVDLIRFVRDGVEKLQRTTTQGKLPSWEKVASAQLCHASLGLGSNDNITAMILDLGGGTDATQSVEPPPVKGSPLARDDDGFMVFLEGMIAFAQAQERDQDTRTRQGKSQPSPQPPVSSQTLISLYSSYCTRRVKSEERADQIALSILSLPEPIEFVPGFYRGFGERLIARYGKPSGLAQGLGGEKGLQLPAARYAPGSTPKAAVTFAGLPAAAGAETAEAPAKAKASRGPNPFSRKTRMEQVKELVAQAPLDSGAASAGGGALEGLAVPSSAPVTEAPPPSSMLAKKKDRGPNPFSKTVRKQQQEERTPSASADSTHPYPHLSISASNSSFLPNALASSAHVSTPSVPPVADALDYALSLAKSRASDGTGSSRLGPCQSSSSSLSPLSQAVARQPEPRPPVISVGVPAPVPVATYVPQRRPATTAAVSRQQTISPPPQQEQREPTPRFMSHTVASETWVISPPHSSAKKGDSAPAKRPNLASSLSSPSFPHAANALAAAAASTMMSSPPGSMAYSNSQTFLSPPLQQSPPQQRQRSASHAQEWTPSPGFGGTSPFGGGISPPFGRSPLLSAAGRRASASDIPTLNVASASPSSSSQLFPSPRSRIGGPVDRIVVHHERPPPPVVPAPPLSPHFAQPLPSSPKSAMTGGTASTSGRGNLPPSSPPPPRSPKKGDQRPALWGFAAPEVEGARQRPHLVGEKFVSPKGAAKADPFSFGEEEQAATAAATLPQEGASAGSAHVHKPTPLEVPQLLLSPSYGKGKRMRMTPMAASSAGAGVASTGSLLPSNSRFVTADGRLAPSPEEENEEDEDVPEERPYNGGRIDEGDENAGDDDDDEVAGAKPRLGLGGGAGGSNVAANDEDREFAALERQLNVKGAAPPAAGAKGAAQGKLSVSPSKASKARSPQSKK